MQRRVWYVPGGRHTQVHFWLCRYGVIHLMWAATGSQWWENINGVVWENLCRLKSSPAAAYWISFRVQIAQMKDLPGTGFSSHLRKEMTRFSGYCKEETYTHHKCEWPIKYLIRFRLCTNKSYCFVKSIRKTLSQSRFSLAIDCNY